jgi:hypothetical protein
MAGSMFWINIPNPRNHVNKILKLPKKERKNCQNIGESRAGERSAERFTRGAAFSLEERVA